MHDVTRKLRLSRTRAAVVSAFTCMLCACASTHQPPDGTTDGLSGWHTYDEYDESAAGNEESGSDTDDHKAYVPQETDTQDALSRRMREARRAASNPYVITAHKHNFFMPVSYSTRLNEQIYQQNDVALREGLNPTEVNFQISLKNQLNEQDLWLSRDALSVGITIESWWQLYSDDLSSPFRESNYQPEIFYTVPLSTLHWPGQASVTFGLEHQSNGQVQGLSRSWNRIYSSLMVAGESWIARVRPWYRIPEKAKESPLEAEGDDNPDIHDYMGYADVSVILRRHALEYGLMVRGNPSTGKGALQLDVTFPLFGRFRGLLRYFNGYGDSLIDYNHFQQRLGLGLALTRLY